MYFHKTHTVLFINRESAKSYGLQLFKKKKNTNEKLEKIYILYIFKLNYSI